MFIFDNMPLTPIKKYLQSKGSEAKKNPRFFLSLSFGHHQTFIFNNNEFYR